MSTSRKLNLGCGRFKRDGFVNVDTVPECKPDVLHDLNDMPYPFADDQFQLVEADHVLEHLSDPFAAMRELHRIVEAGGTVRIRVPHFSRGFTHPEHKRGFNTTFPLYFDPGFEGGYQGVQMDLVRMRMRWFAQPYLARTLVPAALVSIAQILGAVFNTLANLSPFLCSRLWCFWVGGFEEIEFQFTVHKGA